MRQKVLQINELAGGYKTRQGICKAVDNVSLTLHRGEFLGIAGESGCGKSTLALAIMGLLEDSGKIFSGEMIFQGKELTSLSAKELQKVRWKGISMVFQSAMNALNPVLKIEEQLVDVSLAHEKGLTRREAGERSREMLELVDIAPDRMHSYPHQLSGGMKQRVMIAMALLLKPQIIIMDEPTTALDVVVQRTIIDKIVELQNRFEFSVMFITHDLSLLVEVSDTLAIMYSGEIVEYGPADLVYAHPGHPYTHGLMHAFPPLTGEIKTFGGIPGKPPNFLNLPAGCRFNPRCADCRPLCTRSKPELKRAGQTRLLACHFPKSHL